MSIAQIKLSSVAHTLTAVQTNLSLVGKSLRRNRRTVNMGIYIVIVCWSFKVQSCLKDCRRCSHDFAKSPAKITKIIRLRSIISGWPFRDRISSSTDTYSKYLTTLCCMEKGLEVLDLPWATHNHLLPLLSNSLPIYDEICKRSASFIAACLCSDCNLVKSVVNYGIVARCHSVVDRNVMFLTRCYAWSLDQLASGRLLPCNADFVARYLSTVTSDEIWSAHFAMELLCLREHFWEFSNSSNNNMSFLIVEEIDNLLTAVLC